MLGKLYIDSHKNSKFLASVNKLPSEWSGNRADVTDHQTFVYVLKSQTSKVSLAERGPL
jgi:hypothetical protein